VARVISSRGWHHQPFPVGEVESMADDRPHTSWSDPGRWQTRLSELPSNPAAIPDALENFVIHHAIARQMGIGVLNGLNRIAICEAWSGSSRHWSSGTIDR